MGVPSSSAEPTGSVRAEVYQRIMSRLPELSTEVIRRIVADVPVYSSLPAEELAGDIVRTIERGVVLFAGYLVGSQLPDDEELAQLRSSAALRAEEGIPVDVVIGVYHLAASVIWDAVMADVDDVGGVLEVHDRVLTFLRAVVPAVAAGYVDARTTALGEEHHDRELLLASLLEGAPAPALHAAGSATLAASYVVMSLRIGLHPDEAAAGVNADVVARRKVRRLRAEAEHWARGPVLSTVDAGGGLLLIPQRKHAEELDDADWTDLAALTQRMSKSAGADLIAGAAAAEPADVAAAARLAREVLEVVLALDRPSGLYRLDDVLFEYQLTRPGPARDGLAALLEPLAGKAGLLDTVGAFLKHGANRRRAAQALHVHPNTVDYRLGRVAELTGLDPSDAHGARLLAAAHAARAIAEL